MIEQLKTSVSHGELLDGLRATDATNFVRQISSCFKFLDHPCDLPLVRLVTDVNAQVLSKDSDAPIISDLNEVVSELKMTLQLVNEAVATKRQELPLIIGALEPEYLGPTRQLLREKMVEFFSYFDCLYSVPSLSGARKVPKSCNRKGETSSAEKDQYLLDRNHLIRICTDAAGGFFEICGGSLCLLYTSDAADE